MRHTADAPAVDVRSGDTELAGDLANGQEIVLGPLAAGMLADRLGIAAAALFALGAYGLGVALSLLDGWKLNRS